MQAFKLLTISSLLWVFLLSGAVLAQDKSSPKIPNQLLPETLEKRCEQPSDALSRFYSHYTWQESISGSNICCSQCNYSSLYG